MIDFPNFNPVAVDLGIIQIHWYGLMYLTGLLIAWYLAKKQKKRLLLSDESLSDLVFYITIGVIAGGRIGYMLFYQARELFGDPLSLIRFWAFDASGQYYFVGLRGMSFHGGLIGVVVMCYYFSKKNKIPFWQITDFIAPLAPIGLGLGRLGNFINGELWGRPSEVPWAMVFPMVDDLPRHPSQLYEFCLEGIALYFILKIYSMKKRYPAQVSGVFLMGYGTFRFIIEFFREPDRDQGFIAFDWLTKGQLLCLPMIAFGILLYLYHYTQKRGAL